MTLQPENASDAAVPALQQIAWMTTCMGRVLGQASQQQNEAIIAQAPINHRESLTFPLCLSSKPVSARRPS